jgi:hypothetical protein
MRKLSIIVLMLVIFCSSAFALVGVSETFEQAAPTDPTWTKSGTCINVLNNYQYTTAPIEGLASLRAFGGGTDQCGNPTDWKVDLNNNSIIMKLNFSSYGNDEVITIPNYYGGVRFKASPNNYMYCAGASVNGYTILDNMNTSQIYVLHLWFNGTHFNGSVWMSDGGIMYSSCVMEKDAAQFNIRGIGSTNSDYRVDCYTTYNGTNFVYSNFPYACQEGVLNLTSNITAITNPNLVNPDYVNYTLNNSFVSNVSI